jgi:hypothetical protein
MHECYQHGMPLLPVSLLISINCAHKVPNLLITLFHYFIIINVMKRVCADEIECLNQMPGCGCLLGFYGREQCALQCAAAFSKPCDHGSMPQKPMIL